MPRTQSSLADQRAEALAIVHLTRRADLRVQKIERALGVDLIVRLIRHDILSERSFGVAVKGVIPPIESADAATRILEDLRRQERTASTSVPICVFLFSMKGDQGYYSWLVEPVVSDETAHLVDQLVPAAKPLDPPALDEIVRVVDQWYETLYRKVLITAGD